MFQVLKFLFLFWFVLNFCLLELTNTILTTDFFLINFFHTLLVLLSILAAHQAKAFGLPIGLCRHLNTATLYQIN